MLVFNCDEIWKFALYSNETIVPQQVKSSGSMAPEINNSGSMAPKILKILSHSEFNSTSGGMLH